MFPANQEDSWFFRPVSETERRAVRESGPAVRWDREEPVGGFTHLHQVYVAGAGGNRKGVTGRVTVPLLFDSKAGRCISSESEDIASILLGRFRPLHATPRPGLYPAARRDEIHREIKVLTKEVNSIVYGIHFAKTQAAFEEKMEFCADEFDADQRIRAAAGPPPRQRTQGQSFTESELSVADSVASALGQKQLERNE